MRGRVGILPIPDLLVYGTGGLAYGQVSYTGNFIYGCTGCGKSYPATDSTTRLGWTAGTGAELHVWDNFSVKLEYLYYDLGRHSITSNPVFTNTPYQSHYNFDTRGSIMRVG